MEKEHVIYIGFRRTIATPHEKDREAQYPSTKSRPKFLYILLQHMINIYRGTRTKTKNLWENDHDFEIMRKRHGNRSHYKKADLHFDCNALEVRKLAYTKSIKVLDNWKCKGSGGNGGIAGEDWYHDFMDGPKTMNARRYKLRTASSFNCLTVGAFFDNLERGLDITHVQTTRHLECWWIGSEKHPQAW